MSEVVTCEKWRSIFLQNLQGDKGAPYWKFNIEALAKDMFKVRPHVAAWN